jgi:hypothetical protein
MATNKRATAIGGVVLGLLLATAGGHASSGNQSLLTFSGAVALPNGSIGAGTYTFEVVNPGSSGNLVSVRTKNRVCYLGFTRRIERPRDLRADRFVSLGESRIGVAPPILAWYPTGDAHGYEFIYASR